MLSSKKWHHTCDMSAQQEKPIDWEAKYLAERREWEAERKAREREKEAERREKDAHNNRFYRGLPHFGCNHSSTTSKQPKFDICTNLPFTQGSFGLIPVSNKNDGRVNMSSSLLWSYSEQPDKSFN